MTPLEVLNAVEKIRQSIGDPEIAHGSEDALMVAVLEEIMNGHPEPREMARIVLRTQEFDSSRWYA